VPQDLQERSKQAFLESVKERSKLLTLRSYLNAYANISLEKLAKFCGVSPADVRRQLDALVASGLARSSGIAADASVDGTLGAEKCNRPPPPSLASCFVRS
jgi:predicted DNA-binding transcriptional regulator YafY